MPAEQQMHGLSLEEILIAVWYDGCNSGVATGCGLFLPGPEADAKADEITEQAAAAPAIRREVRREVRARLQTIPTEQPMPDLNDLLVDKLLAPSWYDGFTSGASIGCCLFLPGAEATAKATEIVEHATTEPALHEQVRNEVRERLQMAMADVEARGQTYTVVTPDRTDTAPSSAPTIVQSTDE